MRSVGVVVEGEAFSEMLVKPLIWSFGAVGCGEVIFEGVGRTMSPAVSRAASIMNDRSGRPAAFYSNR